MKQLLFALALLMGATGAQAADDGAPVVMSEDAMTAMVHAWFRLSGQELEDRGEAGIEPIMALMHEDMRYVHREYDADYDRELLIDGFRRRLQRASTRGSTNTVTNLIAGKNMVVVERSTAYERRTEAGWEKRGEDDLVTLFEFRDGKIWRIAEYWD